MRGQAIEDMWEGFRREFLELWTVAVKRGSAGDLAPTQLFGAAAASGSEALQVGHASHPQSFRHA